MNCKLTPRVILKQPINIIGAGAGTPIRVRMNFMARSLSVGVRNGQFVLWYETPEYFEESVMYDRAIWCIGTGWQLPEGSLRFLNTIQDGEFVWHFFEGALLDPAARQGG